MKKQLSDTFKLFYTSTLHLLLFYFFLLLVLAIFRTIILVFFNPSPDIYNEVSDIGKAYFMGFRFDTIVICYGAIPAVFLNLVGLFTGKRSKGYFAVIQKILRIYYTVFTFIVILISVIDMYFYNFFMTRISVIIFGLVEDDTLTVLKSVWTDYPLIPLLIGLSIGIWIIYKLIGWIQKAELRCFNLNIAVSVALVLLFCTLFMLGIRGSFGFYPLKVHDAVVSKYVFINNLVPNGLYALKTAMKDRKEQDVHTDISKSMKRWGFASAEEAVSEYIGKNIDSTPDSLKSALMATSPHNDFLEQNPPNVVFIQMESMSEHFISLHNKETFNLLGSLETVLPECFHFTHFLSATDATIHTLEGLMINSPMTPVAQSIYMNRTLNTSAAKPFKEKGYNTAFVTSSKLGWRNMDKFIPLQYFDRTEGAANLESDIPGTVSSEWGIYDEFMFTRIYNMLNSGEGKPQFIFGMTITNHTPYSLPNTYKPYPLEIPQALKSRLSAGEEHAKIHFTTYQYANNCLGDFIDKVKSSPLGENTIIVASGDHSARRVFDYSDANMLQKYAVPLIIYIPEKYKSMIETPDITRFASHKDVFPTIYNLSLSDAEYIKSGINLFDKEALSSNFAISSYKLIMNNTGAVYYDSKPLFFSWTDSTRTVLKLANQQETDILEKDIVHAKAYTASMTYLVQRSLSDE